jgi:hypothetical protein
MALICLQQDFLSTYMGFLDLMEGPDEYVYLAYEFPFHLFARLQPDRRDEALPLDRYKFLLNQQVENRS